MRGAEAVVGIDRIIGRKAVRKSRIRKGYRSEQLDIRLRSERTRVEARLLNRAKAAGVRCPTVLYVGDFDIVMSYIEGRRPEMGPADSREAGRILAALHQADIIHGDFTPANLIVSGKAGSKGTAKGGRLKMNRGGSFHVIDFGLGYVSDDIEDKAVDVFTMLRALGKGGAKDAFIEGYKAYAKAGKVMERVGEIEKRVRYAF